MTDWKKIAEAQGIRLSDSELAIAVNRLGALEARLKALLPALSPGEEPAPVFAPEEAAK